MAVYLTGDTHGDFDRFIAFSVRMRPSENDVVIVLGDAGLNYYKSQRDGLCGQARHQRHQSPSAR